MSFIPKSSNIRAFKNNKTFSKRIVFEKRFFKKPKCFSKPRSHDIFGYHGEGSDGMPYFTLTYANGPCELNFFFLSDFYYQFPPQLTTFILKMAKGSIQVHSTLLI